MTVAAIRKEHADWIAAELRGRGYNKNSFLVWLAHQKDEFLEILDPSASSGVSPKYFRRMTAYCSASRGLSSPEAAPILWGLKQLGIDPGLSPSHQLSDDGSIVKG